MRERDRQRDRERETEKERGIDDRTCNLSMCLNWSLNLQPFGEVDDTPTN